VPRWGKRPGGAIGASLAPIVPIVPIRSQEKPRTGGRTGLNGFLGNQLDGGPSTDGGKHPRPIDGKSPQRFKSVPLTFLGSSPNFAKFGLSSPIIRCAGENEGNGGSLAFTARLLLLREQLPAVLPSATFQAICRVSSKVSACGVCWLTQPCRLHKPKKPISSLGRGGARQWACADAFDLSGLMYQKTWRRRVSRLSQPPEGAYRSLVEGKRRGSHLRSSVWGTSGNPPEYERLNIRVCPLENSRGSITLAMDDA
jgi:hypothetical protein